MRDAVYVNGFGNLRPLMLAEEFRHLNARSKEASTVETRKFDR